MFSTYMTGCKEKSDNVSEKETTREKVYRKPSINARHKYGKLGGQLLITA